MSFAASFSILVSAIHFIVLGSAECNLAVTNTSPVKINRMPSAASDVSRSPSKNIPDAPR